MKTPIKSVGISAFSRQFSGTRRNQAGTRSVARPRALVVDCVVAALRPIYYYYLRIYERDAKMDKILCPRSQHRIPRASFQVLVIANLVIIMLCVYLLVCIKNHYRNGKFIRIMSNIFFKPKSLVLCGSYISQCVLIRIEIQRLQVCSSPPRWVLFGAFSAYKRVFSYDKAFCAHGVFFCQMKKTPFLKYIHSHVFYFKKCGLVNIYKSLQDTV